MFQIILELNSVVYFLSVQSSEKFLSNLEITDDRQKLCFQFPKKRFVLLSYLKFQQYLTFPVCIYKLLVFVRERGVKIVNLELKCGDVTVNIDERLFYKKHTKPENNSGSENDGDANPGTSSTKQSSKSKSILPLLKKQMLAFPDKVCQH